MTNTLLFVQKLKRHIPLIPYYIEALGNLIFCKILIVFFPFNSYSKKYGLPFSETFQAPLPEAIEEIKAISTVLKTLPPYLPWNSKCLDQAMAATRMLKKRQLQHTLYFGIAKINQETVAHAWIRSGKHWIVGYQPHIQYAVVGVYAWVH